MDLGPDVLQFFSGVRGQMVNRSSLKDKASVLETQMLFLLLVCKLYLVSDLLTINTTISYNSLPYLLSVPYYQYFCEIPMSKHYQ